MLGQLGTQSVVLVVKGGNHGGGGVELAPQARVLSPFGGEFGTQCGCLGVALDLFSAGLAGLGYRCIPFAQNSFGPMEVE